jgi:hypothetical protein
MSASPALPAPRASFAVRALLLAAAVALAVTLNAVVAALAVAAGAPADYPPLTLPALTTFTALGVIAGWIGWVLIHRMARNPRVVLRVLVPAVVVLSLVPNVVLLATGFIPGTTVVGVVALMVMHVLVAAVAVPAYAYASRS